MAPVGLLVAICLIAVGDRILRARQNLIHHLSTGDLYVMIPFADPLRERIERKNTWDRLHEQVAAARAAGDRKRLFDSAYELASFMTAEIGADDPRRRTLLEGLIRDHPEASEATEAYWALLSPDWHGTLRDAYPRYAEALTTIASAAGGEQQTGMLLRLAGTMRERGEEALELRALQALRDSSRISLETEPAMRRLLELLPADNPTRAALQADLDAFVTYRRQLTEAARWYAGFVTSTAKASWAGMAQQRAAAPDSPHNAFFASADALLAHAAMREGRLDEARRLRRALALNPVDDSNDAANLAMELAEAESGPDAPRRRAPTAHPPDEMAILYQRWRGLLEAGRIDDAQALTATLAGTDRTVSGTMALEAALAAGDTGRLSPLLVLRRRTEDLPAELAGAREAWFGQLELKPAGRAVPAQIKAAVEFWLTDERVLLIARADEPRPPTTAATTRPRDSDLSKDETIEFAFNPDRWFDFEYIVTVSSRGSVSDILQYNDISLQRRRYRHDRAIDLEPIVRAERAAGGWAVRLLLPRQRIFPAGAQAIRFNARRARHVVEGEHRVVQFYSWSPRLSTGEVRPEHLGWVLVESPDAPAGGR